MFTIDHHNHYNIIVGVLHILVCKSRTWVGPEKQIIILKRQNILLFNVAATVRVRRVSLLSLALPGVL